MKGFIAILAVLTLSGCELVYDYNLVGRGFIGNFGHTSEHLWYDTWAECESSRRVQELWTAREPNVDMFWECRRYLRGTKRND